MKIKFSEYLHLEIIFAVPWAIAVIWLLVLIFNKL